MATKVKYVIQFRYGDGDKWIDHACWPDLEPQKNQIAWLREQQANIPHWLIPRKYRLVRRTIVENDDEVSEV